MTTENTVPLYYFTIDLSRLMGVSSPTVKRWDDKGHIPKSTRLGPKRAWVRASIDNYLQEVNNTHTAQG